MTPNFTTSQLAGTISTCVFNDTSTGDVSAITNRLIYFRKLDATYLVPSGYTTTYVPFPIGSNTLNIPNLLDKDYCLEITCVFYSGSSISVSKTILTLFTAYGETFLRRLTQAEAADRSKLDNKNWWESKIKLRTLLDDATQAVSLSNDQTIATFCLNEAKYLTDNPSLYF